MLEPRFSTNSFSTSRIKKGRVKRFQILMMLVNLLKRQCLIVHIVINHYYIFLQRLDSFFTMKFRPTKVASWNLPFIIKWVNFFIVIFIFKILVISIEGCSITVLLSVILISWCIKYLVFLCFNINFIYISFVINISWSTGKDLF